MQRAQDRIETEKLDYTEAERLCTKAYGLVASSRLHAATYRKLNLAFIPDGSLVASILEGTFETRARLDASGFRSFPPNFKGRVASSTLCLERIADPNDRSQYLVPILKLYQVFGDLHDRMHGMDFPLTAPAHDVLHSQLHLIELLMFRPKLEATFREVAANER